MKQLGSLEPDKRREAGQILNSLQKNIIESIDNKKSSLEETYLNEKLKNEALDITLPTRPENIGRIHPLSKTMDEVISIFAQMGFTVAEGPDIESDFYNFTALNFPENHPAREMQDTFFISKDPDVVLRTHTSNVQIRLMEKQKPPMRVIIPGRVYRNETVSAKSHCFFHQVEGLYIDKNVSFKDLKDTLYYFAKEMFGSDTKVRFRPSYFPFTEPSAEVDIWDEKRNQWMEILGCGMVDPAVLTNVGYNPEKWHGYAFGMGVERIAMLKYEIDDIRNFYSGDIRVLEQFI